MNLGMHRMANKKAEYTSKTKADKKGGSTYKSISQVPARVLG